MKSLLFVIVTDIIMWIIFGFIFQDRNGSYTYNQLWYTMLVTSLFANIQGQIQKDIQKSFDK